MIKLVAFCIFKSNLFSKRLESENEAIYRNLLSLHFCSFDLYYISK